jgi:UDP-N-acetyl-D-mannosaminuronic acid dehydrogenase
MAVYGKGGKEIREAFRRRKLKVAVYGLGKMGLPLAAVFSDKGAIVTGVDVDQAVIAGINAGKCHVRGEPGLPEMVRDNWKAKRISATGDPVKASRESDVKIILIPTLLDDKSMPDLAGILSLCEKIGKGLKKKDMVIIETTMPIGATAKRIRPSLEQASGLAAGKDFGLAYCPERTYSGRAITDILGAYPKVTGGYDQKSTRTASAIYKVINSKGTIETDCTTAEAVKVYEGVYRDVNIALANQLAIASTELGINAVDVYRIANTQPYCRLHDPGAGVGGHCIPVYPYFVINSGIKADTSLLRLARKVNDHMADHVVALTKDALRENARTLKGSKVLVLGLTFRGGVKELRHSRSIPIAQEFKDLGAETYAFDPLLSKEETEALGFKYNGGFSGMDAAVITNDHAEFRKIKWASAIKEMRTKILIDAKQTIRPEKAKAIGFTYRGIGFA